MLYLFNSEAGKLLANYNTVILYIILSEYMYTYIIHPFVFNADIQGTCATSGKGLYDALDWLQSTLTQKEIKKIVTKPLDEMTKSADKAQPPPTDKTSYSLGSWLTSLSKYFVHSQ